MKAKDIFQYALAGVIFLGFFTFMLVLIIMEVPSANKDMLMVGAGTLFGLANLIAGYFFGSNKESASKTEMLYKSTPATNKP
jgi:predicted aspartyl protease